MTVFTVSVAVALVTWACCRWYFRRKTAQLAAAFQQRVQEQEDVIWRTQMNPHFLHNALSCISALINQEDLDQATRQLTRLSRLTRKVLEYSQERLVPLADELELVRQYIALEQLRFGEGLQVNVLVADDIDPKSVYVPPLIVQPFVENAILHGVLPRGNGGTVDLRVSVAGDTLRFQVADNGVGYTEHTGIPSGSSDRKSFGIPVTRKRIEHFNASRGYCLPFVIREAGEAAESDDRATGTVVEWQLALVMDG